MQRVNRWSGLAWLALTWAAAAGEGRLELWRASMPCVITNAGSYVLTEDLQGVAGAHGIRVLAAGVTLDLNGFTLAGVAGSLSGIYAPSDALGLVVRNGGIRGWGGSGIEAPAVACMRVEGVAASENGRDGIRIGPAGVVRECRADGNATNGFTLGVGAVVAECLARANKAHGISAAGSATIRGGACRENLGDGVSAGPGCVVEACTFRENVGAGANLGTGSVVRACSAYRNGDGIRLAAGSLARDSVAYYNHDDGIQAGEGVSVRGCTAGLNGGDGILLTDRAWASENNCWTNTAGIRATGKANRIDNNNLVGNTVGLAVASAGNFIARNTSTRNADSNDYTVVSGNQFQVSTNAGASLPSNPWINFKY